MSIAIYILHNATRVGRNPMLRAYMLTAYMITCLHAYMLTCFHACILDRWHDTCSPPTSKAHMRGDFRLQLTAIKNSSHPRTHDLRSASSAAAASGFVRCAPAPLHPQGFP